MRQKEKKITRVTEALRTVLPEQVSKSSLLKKEHFLELLAFRFRVHQMSAIDIG